MKRLLFILILSPLCTIGQLSSEEKEESQIDSLKQVIKTAKHDSTIVGAWVAWDNLIYVVDFELDIALNEKIDSLCSINLKNKLNKAEQVAFLIGKGYALNSFGGIFNRQGDYGKAIDYYSEGLKVYEKINFKNGIAISLNNIGVFYKEQGDYAKAVDYYYPRSLKINKEIGNELGVATVFNNMGTVYKEQGDYEKAIDYYYQSLKVFEELESKHSIAMSLNNIGTIYCNQGNYTKAIEHYSRSLKINQEIESKAAIANSFNNIGYVYYFQNRYTKAIEYGKDALMISQELEVDKLTLDASFLLSKIYKKKGDYFSALKMYELYIEIKDDLNSEENQRAIIRQEYKYQYEKEAIADSIKTLEETKVKDALLLAHQAESKKNKLEVQQQKQQGYFLYGGLGLALLFGGFIFNRFRITSKQKLIIEAQKNKVDEAFRELENKNQEIMDSINYAKRIQSAILPSDKLMKYYLKDSFIFYKPKDIVAGDFYWLEHRDGKVLFAAADCTGHGVPGAMLSVVCNYGLNRSVREYGLTDPGEILDKTREIVIQEFDKSKDGVNDGMDTALCSLEGNSLQYAGARNPLWVIRNGELLETKGNKQSIGKFDEQIPYTTHTLELEKGDSIYIFSDGYVDQFGGEKGKKFSSKAFRTLLLSIQNKRMEEQRLLISKAFETWRGNLEQIDDVCIIGVRV